MEFINLSMQKQRIFISGKNGQLGQALQKIYKSFPEFEMLFFSREELDITNTGKIQQLFTQYLPTCFINCAAYTGVDKAETDREKAFNINALAVGNIAALCKQFNCLLIHISTDYVFDGKGMEPYKEDDVTNPVNYYGFTKREGERLAFENNARSIIIRTSWVYSPYGSNFVKTMVRLMRERKEISVVSDQFGCPTYAADLALAIMLIVKKMLYDNTSKTPVHFPQVYHFSNSGAITWFEFAEEIKKITGSDCIIKSINTSAYPTPAKRPGYSVLDCNKIVSQFQIEKKNWKLGLVTCLSEF